jgi:hypothetical protein
MYNDLVKKLNSILYLSVNWDKQRWKYIEKDDLHLFYSYLLVYDYVAVGYLA